jgi:hypothetical protein
MAYDSDICFTFRSIECSTYFTSKKHFITVSSYAGVLVTVVRYLLNVLTNFCIMHLSFSKVRVSTEGN